MKNYTNKLTLFYLVLFTSVIQLHSQTQTITGPGYYSWPGTHVVIEFESVPRGGGEVTVTEYALAPTPPPPGGTVIPYYVEISTDMPDNAYTANINIEDAASVGINANVFVETPDCRGDVWLLIEGNYQPGIPDIYNFRVNRFSLFSFLAPAVEPNHLFLCTNNISPSQTSEVYQTDDGNQYFQNDWGYTPNEHFFSVYIKPENMSKFYGSDLHLRWDDSKIEFLSVEKGNVFPTSNFNYYTFPEVPADSIIIQAAAQNIPPENILVTDDKYIAKLNFRMIQPGFSLLEVTKCEFRDSVNQPLYFVHHNFKSKYFLGDFRNAISESSGDGLVDFNDLFEFSPIYNSTSSGWDGSQWLPEGTQYKRKFDIGPTDGSHYIFDNPLPDNKIDFEDLILFAISYGFSNEKIYPNTIPGNFETLETVQIYNSGFLKHPSASTQIQDQIIIPIRMSYLADIKGFHVEIDLIGKNLEFIEIEKKELLSNSREGSTLLFYKIENNTIFIDGALLTTTPRGIPYEGVLFNLIFNSHEELTPNISVKKALIRDSFNRDYQVALKGPDVKIPLKFKISSCYPNPFNGTTRFKIDLTEPLPLEIDVFNALGQKIQTYFNGRLEGGCHEFSWNTTQLRAGELASGIFYLRIQSGGIIETQKLLLVK